MLLTMVNYQYEIIRHLKPDILSQIINLEREHCYENRYDQRYWNGGAGHAPLEETLAAQHQSDSSSLLLLIRNDHTDEIVAFARFSVNYKTFKNYRLSKIHTFAVTKKLTGRLVRIAGKETKASSFILEKMIERAEKEKSDLLLSQITVFPYPNLPCLRLLRKYDFLSIGDRLYTDELHGDTGSSILLGRIINKSLQYEIPVAISHLL